MSYNRRYLQILNNLENTSADKNLNSRILLVDGLNSFIRAFAVNPTMNENGIHVGGIAGFLFTIGYAIKNIRPTRVIIVFDGPGGSVRRRQIYSEYKANRSTETRISKAGYYATKDEERKSMMWQIKRLVEYLKYFPVQSMVVRDIEADDAIAYLIKNDLKEHDVVIMSTDKDFLQLIDDRTKVWSPTKKQLYTIDNVTEEYEIPSHNWAIYRSLTGDQSDNIPGIKGIGMQIAKKRFPILFENKRISVDDIFIYTKQLYEITNKKGKKVNNYKVYKELLDNKEQLKLNYKLVQLEDVNISNTTKVLISNQVKQPINRLVKYQILKLILEDRINLTIKNPDLWIREVFSELDKYAVEQK